MPIILLREKNTKGYNIFIGSDSFISGGRVCFATAVCLHSAGNGSRYFFYKEKKPAKMFSQLSARILEEARRLEMNERLRTEKRTALVFEQGEDCAVPCLEAATVGGAQALGLEKLATVLW